MGAFDDVLSANAAYARDFTDSGRPGRAARRLAVVTCMDSRISPLAMLGLADGDAKILRNAGARVTDDVLRTLVLAVHLLDVDRVMVVAHTDCRMSSVTDAEVHQAIAETAGIDTRSLDFRTIPDQRATLARGRAADPQLALPAGGHAGGRRRLRRAHRPDRGRGSGLSHRRVAAGTVCA